MARRATLTTETLATLGIEKLTKLVLDEAGRNALFKKLVVAALASAKGPDAVAAIIDRRLSGLERARGFVEWDKGKALAADLGATLTTITDELGPADPSAAVLRLVRFLVCAPSVFERVDDSSSRIQDIFHAAADAAPGLVSRIPDDERRRFVERLVPLLVTDEYGLIETFVHGTIPLLTVDDLAVIDARLEALVKESGPSKADGTRDWARLARRDRVIRARQAIADQAEDVDKFILLASRLSDGRHDNLGIAERLLEAGRATEALDWVRRPSKPGLRAMTTSDVADASAGTDLSDRSRVRLEVLILTALKQKDAAQDLRWRAFEAGLDDEILRDYLSNLPDFEDDDALERAFAHVEAQPHRYRSLGFFLAWPRRDLAAKLVVDHRATWSGQHYGVLAPAAEALEHDFPVAATVLYRALLDDILARARSPAYRYAARYLAKLGDLQFDGLIAAGLTNHETYCAELRKLHGRKTGFWSLIGR